MDQILYAGNRNDLVHRVSQPPYEVVSLREGDVVFRAGEVPKGLYYVESGSIKMSIERSFTRGRTGSPEYVTKLVSPGEYFGFKALVRNGSHLANATAVMPTTIWVYPRDLVGVALRTTNPLVKYLLEQAVADLENYESVSQLHYLASVQERIAFQLVRLAEKFGVPENGGISLNLKLTRNELAQLASTINESLSRHLTEFKNEGLIEVSGKEILIRDIEGLKARSGNFPT